MTVPWSLTTTAPGRIDTTIGMADGHDVGRDSRCWPPHRPPSTTPGCQRHRRPATNCAPAAELVAIIRDRRR